MARARGHGGRLWEARKFGSPGLTTIPKATETPFRPNEFLDTEAYERYAKEAEKAFSALGFPLDTLLTLAGKAGEYKIIGFTYLDEGGIIDYRAVASLLPDLDGDDNLIVTEDMIKKGEVSKVKTK